MDTYIAYFDESGDDGVTTESSELFVLSSLYMNADKWQNNFDKIRLCRKELKEQFGFHVTEELHTKNFLSDKDPYRKHKWLAEEKKEIVKSITKTIASLDARIINVIIDKTRIQESEYPVLKNALTYNIQRIENDSNGEWNYIIISDKGRIAPMRKTARAIRVYNPIQSKFASDYRNLPIKNLIEDILEKDSRDSYFIQVCDFVAYCVNLYYKARYKNEPFPNRVGRVIDIEFVSRMLTILKTRGLLNLKANSKNDMGLVIYPN